MIYSDLIKLFNAGNHNAVIAELIGKDSNIDSDPHAAQIAASSLFSLGRYIDADNILKQHEGAMSHDGPYLSLCGAVSRRLGRLPEARQFFKRALDNDPHSIAIRNNYANLLIDLEDYHESKAILVSILNEQPDFSDAQQNLKRLESLTLEAAVVTEKSVNSGASAWTPQDPLMLAFAEDEVRQAGAVNFQKNNSISSQSLISKMPEIDSFSVESDRLKLATRSIQDDNPSFALSLISKAAHELGAHVSIYMNAADAYIRLQRFREAEILYLHVLQIGGPSLPAFLNLCTLTMMRGDMLLSRYYLNAVRDIDPSHPQLDRLASQLSVGDNNSQLDFDLEKTWSSPSLAN